METKHEARFVNIPPLDIGTKPEQWILTEACIYQSALTPDLIVVRAGFETDLASIPRIARFFIVKNGRHRAAAIVHDYLCRLKLDFSRVRADKIFLEAMKLRGVPRIRRRLMYWAVRANTSRLKLIGKAR
ncbi:MAG: DUF1353 domain-containing protein [Bacteroidales bacterium]|nr:DUF1353 domain-containing protein [Candidatus Latescibacterota bacterium]